VVAGQHFLVVGLVMKKWVRFVLVGAVFYVLFKANYYIFS